MNWLETILIFLCMGIITTVGNLFGYNIPVTVTIIGFAIMMVITLAGMLLAHIMPIKLPMVFWISIVAVLSTSPISPAPIAQTVTAYVNKVDFLALCTPILAYAGLSIGKDLGVFKKMSWRIIEVALATYTGTFICATAIAQVMLHVEGLI